jgi:CheY-like chemotaxis protein
LFDSITIFSDIYPNKVSLTKESEYLYCNPLRRHIMRDIDWNVLLPEIIKILPTSLLLILVITVALILRDRMNELFGRLTRFGAFGVEIEFGQVKEQLRQAIGSYSPGEEYVDDTKLKAILKRAERIQDLLLGVRILWVDDHPLANANIHRFLNNYGVVIDNVRETDEALIALRWASSAYELIISDMNRNGNTRAGLELLEGVSSLNLDKPVIIFVANLNKELGIPKDARTITDDVGELIHHIFDVVERVRQGDQQS